jgi:5-hydroxyisourate hydrolase-like protein (transthyretin family)
MATNTLLNADMITKRALLILHQKLTFIGNINRAYDDSFAQDGAKIGSTLRIRQPNQFTVRSGASLSVQNVVETNVPLTVDTQLGVDFEFSSKELTMNIDDYAKRYLEPAMARLAAQIEANVWTQMYRSVAQVVDADGVAPALIHLNRARKRLTDSLAPPDNRNVLLSTDHTVKFVDAFKGLFQDSTQIKDQYREGMLGRIAGFDLYESTHVSDHQTGTAAAVTAYLSNGVGQSGSTINVDGGTTTFLAGDIITFAGVFDIHPETKVSMGVLKQFVVTANSGTSATSLAISPAIVATGARQNVSNTITDNSAVGKLCGAANALMNSSMAFHKDAFTFATADLVLPKGTDMASRQVYDGISLRFVRDYTISDDQFPARFDVLYGAQAIRPELACRIHADG